MYPGLRCDEENHLQKPGDVCDSIRLEMSPREKTAGKHPQISKQLGGSCQKCLSLVEHLQHISESVFALSTSFFSGSVKRKIMTLMIGCATLMAVSRPDGRSHRFRWPRWYQEIRDYCPTPQRWFWGRERDF